MSLPLRAAESVLVVPASVRARLEEWACARYPHEACGLLLGRREGPRTTLADAREARNLAARAHDTYELDPAAHLAAEEAARARGLEVVGIWHSHPDHAARPSERDRAAAWEGWSYVIVPVLRGRAGALRAWRREGARFAEELVDSAPA